MFNILVAEDDESARMLLEAVLRGDGYAVFAARDGAEALALFGRQQIDLVVLDVAMPHVDGYAFTKQLRESGFDTPILMVTARQLPADKKKGFLSGADDYMVKPIDTEEMLLRIRALFRRAKIVAEHRLVVGDVVLDYDALSVARGGDVQTLPQKEFYLLFKLLSSPGRIFTRLQLMDEIWGMESDSTDTTITVHINRLRRRFERYPEFELQAVRGLGYRAVRKP